MNDPLWVLIVGIFDVGGLKITMVTKFNYSTFNAVSSFRKHMPILSLYNHECVKNILFFMEYHWAHRYVSNFLTFLLISKSQYFSDLKYNCSNILDLRNLQEQVRKAFCFKNSTDFSLFE